MQFLWYLGNIVYRITLLALLYGIVVRREEELFFEIALLIGSMAAVFSRSDKLEL